MAEVMNEFSSSNGEVDDENDEIKLNGDACDDASSVAVNSPSQPKDDQLHESISSKDKRCSPSNKKVDCTNDTDHNKTREQNSVKSCSSTVVPNVANGRLKSDAPSSAENDENSRENNKNDESQLPSKAIAKKHIFDAADKSITNDCNSSSPSNERVIDGSDADDGDNSNCDSNKAECGRQSSPKTDNNDTSSTTKDDAVTNSAFSSHSNALSITAIDENGAKIDDEVVATDLSKRSNDAAADKKLDANGGDEDDEANEDDEVISISSTPDKSKKSCKKPSMSIVNITPRRSSRNLNKQQKSYVEKEAEFESSGSDGAAIMMAGRKRPAGGSGTGEDDEIEEITPTDPLADEPSRSSASKMRGNKTIVVSDTKGLVEFASNTKASRSNKKEPTLVIIDTNSILSGRGPIPVSQQAGSNSLLHSSSSSAPIPVSLPIPAGAFANAARGGSGSSSSAFSVIPIGLPAQGMYSQFKNPPPQIKPIVVGPASTSVTPVPMAQSTAASTLSATTITTVASTQPTNKQPPVILPSLTDDMFVVEAPSFIVPYVYEKPPMKSLKEHIEKIEIDIKQQAAEEAEREQERAEESKDSAPEKTSRSDSEEKSVADGDAAVASSKDKVDESAKEDATKDDSKQPDQDGETAVKDQTTKEQDKSDAEKKVTSKEGDSAERMEVDEEPDTASKPPAAAAAATAVESDIVKKMEIDSSPVNAVKEIEKKITAGPTTGTDDPKKPVSYFDNPLGKFFMQIGLNLVQEHVQTDLLRSQKRKRDKEGVKCSPDVHSAIDELTKTLESSKENNDPFKLELKKCELCSFKTESLLVMAHHLETPHMKNYTYRCNFCPLEVRSPHDILFHMEAEHNIRGRLERAPAFHQCPNCPFEDNQKGKLTRHLISCSKKYRPERNQEPPLDWEPPAKIPRVTRNRPPSMSPGNAVYQAAMSGLKQVPQNTLLPKLMPNTTNMKHNMLNAANKRPNLANSFVNRFPSAANAQPNFQQRPISMQTPNQAMMFRAGGGANSQTPVLLSQGYHLSGAQIYQTQNNKSQSTQQSIAAAKLLNQPSISITPLPRQTSASNNTSSGNAKSGAGKPMNAVAAANKGGGNFVVCEICDGYIKDLEQLRNHMQWIHKVKIHPKMIYNRPPLNCQKCQERFFTDQGLERHLLGAHGLVTSSMQEAANKGKDGGRCPVCGRVYQWKLLNHVARDHQMALKPAHLSYKCTVCTATFGMYKQFESHVYSAHSVVAKRAMDTSKKPPSAPSSSQNDTLLKPLKINDEITIIPQPVRSTRPSNKESNAATITKTVSGSKKMDCENNDNDNSTNSKDDIDERKADDRLCKCVCLMGNFADYEGFRRHVTEKHLKSFKIILSRLDLKSLNRIPNKENAFKLTKFDRNLISDEVRDKYKLSDFFIEIKRHRLRSDFKYKIVENGRRVERYQNPDAVHVVPEAVYSDADPDDGRKRSKLLMANTLYGKRMAERHLLAAYDPKPALRKIAPAPAPARVPVPAASSLMNGGKQKRLISRGRRNAARQSARKYTTDGNEINSSTSDDDVNVIDERRPPPLAAFQQNASSARSFSDHFMTDLASFSTASSTTRRDASHFFSSASSATMSRRTVTASRQTTNIPAKNQQPSKYQQLFAAKRASSGPFTVFNQQTVTTSTSSTTFGTIGSKPIGSARSGAAANASNASNSMQFCRQRSVKVTRRVTTYRGDVGNQHRQPNTRPTPPNNVPNKPEAVISLLSDSDSDQSAVEIVDSDSAARKSDDEYILPT